ncbi:hypothetical protein L0Y46_05055 [bacterium]|nr:hypothetical protein [bacterium]
MDKKNTIAIVVLVIVAILVLIFAYIQSVRTAQENAEWNEWINHPAAPANEENIKIITAKHQYKDGVHTIAGDVELPTPCHILETEARISQDAPSEQVTIVFASKSSDPECDPIIVSERFKVVFKADEDAEILGIFDGENIILNLIEAGPDENLDEFELYIKG